MTAHDCGHRCCEDRDNPHHDHFLAPGDCCAKTECDAVMWSPHDDEIPEGFCHDPATHDVLCTDGRWHPRCERHVPAVIAAQADRVKARA